MGLYQASRMSAHFPMSEMYGYSSSEKVSGKNIAESACNLDEVNRIVKINVNAGTESIQSSVCFCFSITIALPCPPPGDLPYPGIQPRPPATPTLQAHCLLVPSGKPKTKGTYFQFP